MITGSLQNNAENKLVVALYSIAGFIALVGLWRAMPDTVDDAYITFRYAENFLDGNGIVYNIGERVEGFSNPLFLLLMIASGVMRIPMVLAAQGLGLISFALCVVSAFKISSHLEVDRIYKHLAATLTLANFPLLYYSVTGMETGFYACLIAAALWRYYAKSQKVDWLGGLLWLAVALTRPEGIIYPFFLALYEIIRFSLDGDPEQKKARINSIAILSLVGFGFILFIVWRKNYFGDWLPNTFRAKPMGTADLDPNQSAGSAAYSYILGFLIQSGVILPVLSAFSLKITFRTVILWIILLSGIIFGVYTGGDWMPASRYLLPVFIPLAVLSVAGLQTFRQFMQRRNLSQSVERLVLTVIVALAFLAPAYVLYEFITLRNHEPYHILATQDNKEAALAMKEEFGSDKTLVAHRIGALGFFSQMEIIDLFGLVDRNIAEIISEVATYHPNIERGNDIEPLAQYIASKKPDFVLVLSNFPKESEERELYGLMFKHARAYPLGKDQWWHLYERSGE